MTITYRVKLKPDDNGTLLVTCPDLPEVATFGENIPDALKHARDAIEEAIAARIHEGRDLTAPEANRRGYAFGGSPKRRSHAVRLSALTSLKVALYQHLRENEITRAELGRRLNWKRESIDRLFRLNHASRLDQIEAAFGAIDRRLDIEIEGRAS
jgi:antitoxin HicB